MSSLEPLLDDAAATTAARLGFADEAREAGRRCGPPNSDFCRTNANDSGGVRWSLDRHHVSSEELATASKLWADASALLDADVDYTLFWRRFCRPRSGPAPMRWRRSHRHSTSRRRRQRRGSGGIGSRAGAARTPTWTR